MTNAIEKLEQLKGRAQFFKRGHVIPRRVVKCSNRKAQHLLRFGSDTWVVPGRFGYVCFSHWAPGSSCMWLTSTRKRYGCLSFTGGPEKGYSNSLVIFGKTHFLQDYNVPADIFAENVINLCHP